jgi:hypothetical protein
MNHSDLPEKIASNYSPKEVKNARVTSKRGETEYHVFLANGSEEVWKHSNRIGWYKVSHKSGPHMELAGEPC